MKKIMIPLDGSELSRSALPWAELLAGPDTELHLVQAFREPHEFFEATLGLVPRDDVNTGELVEKIRQSLEEQAGGLEQPVKLVAACGEAAESILYQSEHREVDLIVMASHGLGGMDRWLLGSVSTKVLRGSSIPVLVVRSGIIHDQPRLGRILVPLDDSDTAENALNFAAEIARTQNAEIVLYTGFSFSRTGYASALKRYIESGLQEGERHLKELADGLEDVRTSVVVRDSTPGHGIVEAASELGADMIVMGSHGRSGVSRWLLGSVTENVIQRSKLPVLVVYRGRESE